MATTKGQSAHDKRSIHTTIGATNEPDTCLWCGRKLKLTYDGKGRGYYGDGLFDTLSCAYEFAHRLARLGRRLKASE